MALSYLWYSITVCTNSYAIKMLISKYAKLSSDTTDWINFALHDFGARGTIPGGQALGGASHLVNFQGSDTIEGIYAAQKYYGVKEGLPGYSVPATEHSVMSSEGKYGEYAVIRKIFEKFAKPGGIVSIVNDTYDMFAHLNWVCDNLKDFIISSGIRWVTRPDSGKPEESVIRCLDILSEKFGYTVNSKGFKVLHPSVRIIQGDGMDYDKIKSVLSAIIESNYSTENVLFGSGGGLLQKVTRDDLRFAMKASCIIVAGEVRDIYKDPITQDGNYNKKSKKGILGLYYNRETGKYTTLSSKEAALINNDIYDSCLELVYDKGILYREQTLDEIRAISGTW